MKNLVSWHNAKNVKKLELLPLSLKEKKYEGIIKLKLNRQRLHSTDNVKYLGIKIDENLN